MASETLYCMECVEGQAVALGLCADCLAGEPVGAVVGQISRLTRELEEARELIRDLVDDEDAGLVWLGRRLVCAYCTADGLYSVAHAADCPINRARHAIAALRSEAQGDGPVGAVCANCGAPNAAIAGGELDQDEAVCSVECYEQFRELGCPQEHGGDYRPKPAHRGEGGGDGD